MTAFIFFLDKWTALFLSFYYFPALPFSFFVCLPFLLLSQFLLSLPLILTLSLLPLFSFPSLVPRLLPHPSTLSTLFLLFNYLSIFLIGYSFPCFYPSYLILISSSLLIAPPFPPPYTSKLINPSPFFFFLYLSMFSFSHIFSSPSLILQRAFHHFSPPPLHSPPLPAPR